MEAYLLELDEGDRIDQGRMNKAFAPDIDPEHLPDPGEIKARIAKHEEAICQMEETNKKQLLYTDPEAAVMLTKDGGKRACYNLQAATDTESHLVLACGLSNDRNDANKLYATARLAMDNMGISTTEAVADKGYSSDKDIETCLLSGVVPQVATLYEREERVINLPWIPKEISGKKKASQSIGDIRDCLHAGVLPDCYEGRDLTVELQYEGELSCFIRHEDGSVTCPAGKQLFFQGEKKNGKTYGSKEACRSCTNRCTDGKSFRTVKFGPHTRYVPVRMYCSPCRPLQAIPDIKQPDHFHAFGRVKREPARVMVFIRRNRAKLKERFRVSEHPFGTVKFYDGAGYFLCKGKEKAAAEASLMYTSYNIRRAISLAGGVQQLIHRMEEALERMRREGRSLPI